jgi:hypothetical protein
MLVMADAGLDSYELFTAFAAAGAELAWRIGASVSVGRLHWLTDGSYHASRRPRSSSRCRTSTASRYAADSCPAEQNRVHVQIDVTDVQVGKLRQSVVGWGVIRLPEPPGF